MIYTHVIDKLLNYLDDDLNINAKHNHSTNFGFSYLSLIKECSIGSLEEIVAIGQILTELNARNSIIMFTLHLTTYQALTIYVTDSTFTELCKMKRESLEVTPNIIERVLQI